jgi:hypothetical protein
MNDYDLPLTKPDEPELKKQHILVTDQDKCELIDYKLLMKMILPKKKEI